MRLSFRYNSLEGLGFTLFSGPNPIAIYMRDGRRGLKGEEGVGGKRKKGGMEWEEGEGKEGRFSQNLSGNKKGRLCY